MSAEEGIHEQRHGRRSVDSIRRRLDHDHRCIWDFGHFDFGNKFFGQGIEAVDLFQLDGVEMGLESVLIEAE